MRVAVLSESSADEAAIRILVDAIRGEETQAVKIPVSIRTRGVESVFPLLPTVIRSLYYRNEADALVVVVDSNHIPLEAPGEDSQPDFPRKTCRLRRLKESARRELPRLRKLPNRGLLKTAFGLAVPTIEAWYLCGIKAEVSEAAWARGLKERKDPYTRNQLKQFVYDTDRPPLALETARAVEQANRLAANLDLLERKFPIGFRALATSIRNW